MVLINVGSKKGFTTACADLRARIIKLEMSQSVERVNIFK